MSAFDPITDLQTKELNFLQKFIREACGLVITDDKEYLFRYRLEPIIQNNGLQGYPDLCQRLSANDKKLREEVISELTTHETFFFRDRHPFDTFRDAILPWLDEQIQKRKNLPYVRKGPKAQIWCAASSTGQEPYSLAMIINESAKTKQFDNFDISITATDVSSNTLAEAMRGVYRKFEVERGIRNGFSETFRSKFFTAQGDNYEVVDEIKQMVEFKYCNLIEPFDHLGGFDVIFCRNVLIYFDEPVKEAILNRFHTILSPGGFLMLGSSENLYNSAVPFETITHGETLLYKKL